MKCCISHFLLLKNAPFQLKTNSYLMSIVNIAENKQSAIEKNKIKMTEK